MSNPATSGNTSHEVLVQEASMSIQAIASSATSLATDDAIELPELLEGVLTDNQIAEILNVIHNKVDNTGMDGNNKKKQEHKYLDCYVPKTVRIGPHEKGRSCRCQVPRCSILVEVNGVGPGE